MREKLKREIAPLLSKNRRNPAKITDKAEKEEDLKCKADINIL